MKGFRKGFRYISHIFDEKEPEFQIGYPTDVKHVAHIGWEGPSATKPSWMNEFQSRPEISNGDANCTEKLENIPTIPPSSDKSQVEKPRKSRRPSYGANSPLNSPRRRSTDASKYSRPQCSSNNSMDSPSRDSPDGARITKRHLNSSLAVESPASDLPSIPKQSRGRKSKESRLKDKKSAAGIPECGPKVSETAIEMNSYGSQAQLWRHAENNERNAVTCT